MDITPATRASTVNWINATLVNHIFFPFIHSLFMANWVCLNWQKMLIDAIRKHIEFHIYIQWWLFFSSFHFQLHFLRIEIEIEIHIYFNIPIQFHLFDWTMSSTTHIKLINTMARFLCWAWLLLSQHVTLFFTLEMYSLGSICNWHHGKWLWIESEIKENEAIDKWFALCLILLPTMFAFNFVMFSSMFPIDLHIALWILFIE